MQESQWGHPYLFCY